MRNSLLYIGKIALVLFALVVTGQISGQVTPAHAQIVSAIVVQGNQRVEDDTVRAYMQLGPGDVISADRIDESIKALFQTGLFSDVRVFRQGNTLVVQVEENPLINKVRFEGNSEVKKKALKKEVQLRERTIFTRSKVQADVQRIVALYRRSGHFAARVEPKIIRLPQNRVNLIFEINEGSATRIERINFVGNEAFSDGDLRSVVSTAETRWWKFFATTDNYDPDRINYDKELLRRYYLKNGFADFRVVSASPELARDGKSFFITFYIEEGPQYQIGAVTVNTGVTTLDPQKVASVLTMSAGDRYDASRIDKTVENITIEAGKAGFAFAKVQPEIVRDTPNRKLNIVFNIQEGPRVYIERIEIVGNTRTLDTVIRREIRLVEGDAYNRILIDRARRRLTALDFFSKIDIRESRGSAPDKVVLQIVVVEKSTGTISFTAGYSSTEKAIGTVNITERNLLGKGQFARIQTGLSFKRQSIDLSFTEPYFMGRNVAAGFDIFATRTDQNTASSFQTQQLGGALRTGFALSEYQRLDLKYSFTHRIIKVNNPASVSLATARAEGKTNISLFGLSYTYDDLDNPLKPTSGLRVELSESVAGLGGDTFYFKTEAKAYYFIPVYYEGVVLKIKGTAGHIQGWNGKEVPIIDRFYKGGSGSIRGFEIAGIGPRMLNGASGSVDSIGGQTYATGTLELNFPLGLPSAFGLTGSVFTDVATLFNAPEKTDTTTGPNCSNLTPCTVSDSRRIRASVGAGVVWDSPFGPMRIDVAWPLSKAKSDKTELVTFSVGTRF